MRVVRARAGLRREIPLMLVLAVGTAAAYGRVLGNGFVNFDDDVYVYDNPHVREGLSWGGLWWALTTTKASNWHPLTWLSHMLDCQLFGLEAGCHHLTSLLLHILNVLLLFRVLGRMTGAVWRSAVVAVLFALHPLHVESVAWVAERKDVLSSLFFLLTLWAYGAYVKRPGIVRYGLVFGCLAVGLAAKPMLVTTPFVLFLLDLWPLGRLEIARVGPMRSRVLWLVAEKLPLVALSAASSIVTFLVQHRTGATRLTEVVPFWDRLANALVSYVAYLAKAVWPARLAVFYPYRTGIPAWEWLGAVLILVAVTVLVVRRWRHERYLATGWFWYVGMLVPVIGLVQVGRQAMADRYTYVPLTGVFLMVVWYLADRMIGWPRARRTVVTALGGSAILGLGLCTWVQVGYWRSGVSLFGHALEVTEGNALAHNNLGIALDRQGRTDEAIEHYRAALRIDPAYGLAHKNLANALVQKGDLHEAILHCRVALELRPKDWQVHNALGVALADKGMLDEAIEQYQEALRIRPEDPKPHGNLGTALLEKGDTEGALRHSREAVRLAPWDARFHNNLGYVLERVGRFQEAVASYQEAIRLDPAYARPHQNLGSLLARQGRIKEAASHYEEAIRLSPEDPAPVNDLAWIRATCPDPDVREGAEAVRLAERAVELAGRANPNVLDTLAAAYAEAGRFAQAVSTLEEAILLARSAGLEGFLEDLEKRLAFYRSGRPFREPRSAPARAGDGR